MADRDEPTPEQLQRADELRAALTAWDPWFGRCSVCGLDCIEHCYRTDGSDQVPKPTEEGDQ